MATEPADENELQDSAAQTEQRPSSFSQYRLEPARAFRYHARPQPNTYETHYRTLLFLTITQSQRRKSNRQKYFKFNAFTIGQPAEIAVD